MTSRIKQRAATDKSAARTDDDIKILQNRFKVFEQESLPIIEKYDKEGLVSKIDAGRSAEEVYLEVE